MIVGYARVSTDGQTLDAQQAALRSAGCEKVFAEKQSGAKTDRAQLAKAIAALGPGGDAQTPPTHLTPSTSIEVGGWGLRLGPGSVWGDESSPDCIVETARTK
jgi:Resolvase, N terminal domain